MKANELRQKEPVGLKEELRELYREQFNLRMQAQETAGKGQPQGLKRVRRDIARVKTILREKEEK